MTRLDPRRVGPALAAPLIAVVFAGVVSTLVLVIAGDPVGSTYGTLASELGRPRSLARIVNQATIYYLAAVAVAIGFRMNLFNIGVDGQYRLAAFAAAWAGGAVALPGVLHVLVILAVAMTVGALWAGIAALLKVTRGVSEVISTIMLNAIATALVAYLLRRVAVRIEGSNNIGTPPIPESGRVPGLPLVSGSTVEVFGLLLVAIACGVAYAVLLNRTRFGFDLRAAGRSESAAVAAGVDVKRMVVTAMLLSGAVAGLIGMPQLLGASYSYSLDFPAGLGFTGIAVALLGRNSPVGIALGALLWAYLDVSSVRLDLAEVAPEIVQIMQGTIVLSVVVAYELVRRHGIRVEQRRVGRELGTDTAAPTPQAAPA